MTLRRAARKAPAMTEPMPDTPSPAQLVAGLVELLTVKRGGEDSFLGQPQPGGVGRVFGGA